MSCAPSKQRCPWKGVLALVLCAAMWSLNGPLIKLLHAEGEGDVGVSGIAIAFYRSFVGAIVFLPLGIRRVGTLRGARPAWLIASVLAFTFMTATFVIATTLTTAANAIVLEYTSPIWVFLLARVLLGERARPEEAVVLLVAMAGVGIIFGGNPTGQIVGLLVGLASGLGFGLVTIVLRGLRGADPTLVVWINCVGSALILTPGVIFWASFALTSRQMVLILVLGLVQFAIPYVLFSWALQQVEAHRASLIVLLEAVLNPILTFLVVGEAVPPTTLVGGPLILLSVAGWLLLTWRRQNRAQ